MGQRPCSDWPAPYRRLGTGRSTRSNYFLGAIKTLISTCHRVQTMMSPNPKRNGRTVQKLFRNFRAYKISINKAEAANSSPGSPAYLTQITLGNKALEIPRTQKRGSYLPFHSSFLLQGLILIKKLTSFRANEQLQALVLSSYWRCLVQEGHLVPSLQASCHRTQHCPLTPHL